MEVWVGLPQGERENGEATFRICPHPLPIGGRIEKGCQQRGSTFGACDKLGQQGVSVLMTAFVKRSCTSSQYATQPVSRRGSIY